MLMYMAIYCYKCERTHTILHVLYIRIQTNNLYTRTHTHTHDIVSLITTLVTKELSIFQKDSNTVLNFRICGEFGQHTCNC